MTIAVGEVGKLFRYATGFDMSSSTVLTLNFTKPDKTTSTVTSPRVTAPAVPVTDPDLGGLNASEYMQFTLEATDFDQEGEWTVCGIYEDATPKKFIGLDAVFTVLDAC